MSVLETQDFNLGQHANVHLGFLQSLLPKIRTTLPTSSTRLTAAKPWLPVIIWLEQADIVAGDDGTADAVATFENAQGDVALVDNLLYQDEDDWWDLELLDEPIGGSTGHSSGRPRRVACATHQWASQRQSDRVQALRTAPPARSRHQSKVRIRFAMTAPGAGTGPSTTSASIALRKRPPRPRQSTASWRTAVSSQISWQGAAGVRLQKASNLANPNWTDVPDSAGSIIHQGGCRSGGSILSSDPRLARPAWPSAP